MLFLHCDTTRDERSWRRDGKRKHIELQTFPLDDLRHHCCRCFCSSENSPLFLLSASEQQQQQCQTWLTLFRVLLSLFPECCWFLWENLEVPKEETNSSTLAVEFLMLPICKHTILRNAHCVHHQGCDHVHLFIEAWCNYTRRGCSLYASCQSSNLPLITCFATSLPPFPCAGRSHATAADTRRLLLLLCSSELWGLFH